MTPNPELNIPRGQYGRRMAAAVAVGLATACLAALSFGGTASAIGGACAALAVPSIVSFGPAILSIDRAHWGLAVMLCGIVRALGVMALAYALAAATPDVPHRPLYMGAAAGAIVILVAETAIAVTILSNLERRRVRGAAPLAAHAADQT